MALSTSRTKCVPFVSDGPEYFGICWEHMGYMLESVFVLHFELFKPEKGWESAAERRRQRRSVSDDVRALILSMAYVCTPRRQYV